MSLISILIVLVLVGVVLYVVNAVIPMDPKIKLLIQVVVIVAVCLWLLEQFGVIAPFHMRVR